MSDDEHEYRIVHTSGDECEAESMAAARVAAETLIRDNNWQGTSRVWRDDEMMGLLNAGVSGSFAIGGWWKVPEGER
jgi:hypothetical protein